MKYELLPPLTTHEFESLEADIKRNGLLHPIIVDENGDILDGHHRAKIVDKYEPVVMTGLSEAQKKAFVYKMNFTRRNLSKTQKDEQKKNMKIVAKELQEEGVTQADIGAMLGVDQSTISKWFVSNMNNHNTNKPKKNAKTKVPKEAHEDIYERVESGETQEQVAADYGVGRSRVAQITKAVEKKKEKEAEQEKFIEEASTLEIDERYTLYLGDMKEEGKKIASSSVDLILTDPPYPKEYLPKWKDLSELAERVLKPSGFLVAYSGQSYLDQVIAMLSENLCYYWTMNLMHTGGNQLVRGRNVFCGWKPLLVYQKAPLKKKEQPFADIITGTGREKELHEWQQAVKELDDVIDIFSSPGDIILDPFAGSGTTLLAALSNNRGAIGIEIKENNIAIIKGRLNESLQNN